MNTFAPSDEHVFRVLEKDAGIKRRFEEEAAQELQAGWQRDKGGTKGDEEERVRAVVGMLEERERARREGEVVEILRNRGDGGEGDVTAAGVGGDEGAEISRILSRGYGDVKAV
ncbi:Phospholipid-transporting ATPase [Pyrenophora tritici-repentis]|nr:Phospholipid-transporting ATPase [Pyrenophora tritici-repentis]KAI1528288.1 P-type ATPase [Pyrenophora tritici-repentis]KAI1571249.1 P-type ATPase [Pyrenophora tritici-repentis]KAI1596444.1 P-type ATPase [Pyrenophora tritici-repentis]